MVFTSLHNYVAKQRKENKFLWNSQETLHLFKKYSISFFDWLHVWFLININLKVSIVQILISEAVLNCKPWPTNSPAWTNTNSGETEQSPP